MSEHGSRRHALVGSLVSTLCVLYQSLYRAIPANSDVLLGLPIGKEFAHPGLFSPSDFLVASGIRGPFHLYKYLGGFLYQMGANVDLAWEAFFLIFLFLTFLAIWFLAMELTRAAVPSALVLAVLAVAHPLRGSLNASAIPIASFITASAALPFAIAAVTLLFRKRWLASMALASAVFNIHPYIGLLGAMAIAAVILSQRELEWKQRITWIVAGGVLALPNAVYILMHLPSNFSSTGFDLYGQFRQYAMHAFVEDHWREGYGWFVINMAGLMWFMRYISTWQRRTVLLLIGTWCGLMLLYVFNAYVVKNTAVLLMFLFRATYFIKPMLFIIVVNGLYRWHLELRSAAGLKSRNQRLFWIGISLLFLSAILPMKLAVLSDTLALLAYGIFVNVDLTRSRYAARLLVGAGVFLTAVAVLLQVPQFSVIQSTLESIIVGLVVLCGVLLARTVWERQTNRKELFSEPMDSISFGRIVALTVVILLAHHLIISAKDRQLPFVIDAGSIRTRIMMHEAPASTAALMAWAKTSTPQQSLFAIPPDKWEEFGTFRLVAERGLYVTIEEVNQLAYDASIYQQAHQRLERLGTRFPGRRTFTTDGYYSLTKETLHSLCAHDGVDYAVFEKSRLAMPAPSSAIYEDSGYVVIDLHQLSK
jgi:hypothetical protein